jgi:hypothetical protein
VSSSMEKIGRFEAGRLTTRPSIDHCPSVQPQTSEGAPEPADPRRLPLSLSRYVVMVVIAHVSNLGSNGCRPGQAHSGPDCGISGCARGLAEPRANRLLADSGLSVRRLGTPGAGVILSLVGSRQARADARR